jgi:hypothetical protein
MSKRLKLPDQEHLLNILSYDCETGKLWWNVRADRRLQWNKAWSGKTAGCVSKSGYIDVGVDGKIYRAHRIIWKMHYGSEPESIDHINGDVADNRIINLRDVSHQENHRNRANYATNKSGCAGVRYLDRNKKWIARIGVDGVYLYLGLFDKFDDAVDARKKAEKKHMFHKNHGRERE